MCGLEIFPAWLLSWIYTTFSMARGYRPNPAIVQRTTLDIWDEYSTAHTTTSSKSSNTHWLITECTSVARYIGNSRDPTAQPGGRT